MAGEHQWLWYLLSVCVCVRACALSCHLFPVVWSGMFCTWDEKYIKKNTFFYLLNLLQGNHPKTDSIETEKICQLQGSVRHKEVSATRRCPSQGGVRHKEVSATRMCPPQGGVRHKVSATRRCPPQGGVGFIYGGVGYMEVSAIWKCRQ